MEQLARTAGLVLEMAGVLAIIGGILVATLLLLFRAMRDRGAGLSYREFRIHIGRAILLGLELLVAADIIGTVAVQPSFRSVGILAVIVAIRTFLSFSLQAEIAGRWPWKPAKSGTLPASM